MSNTPKKIIAVKTKFDFDPELLFKKLIKLGFKFEGSRDNEVNDVESFKYYGSGPFFYLFLLQERDRQWSMCPGNSLRDGEYIDPEIYNAGVVTTTSITELDIEFLQED